MGKRRQRVLYSLIGFLALVLLIVLIAGNKIAKNKLEQSIQNNLPENISISYNDISVNILTGSLSVNQPSIVLKNKKDSKKHTFFEAEKITTNDFSYVEFLFSNKIVIGQMAVETPNIKHYKERANRGDDNEKPELDKPVVLKKVQLKQAAVDIYSGESDSLILSANNVSVLFKNLTANKSTVNSKIPIHYESLEANGNAIFIQANDYENLTVQSFSVSDKNIKFNNLLFKTKYTKTELSRIIPVERDHYDLRIPMLSIENFDYGFEDENRFFTTVHQISINNPNLNVFRDKLVEDDKSFKPLYARSLREIPFNLTVGSIKINDGAIKYTERTQPENKGGFVSFKNLNANISNIGNTYTHKKTVLNVNALFMDEAPLKVEWSFDVQNQNDHFVFKGELGHLNAKKMNNFTVPNLKIDMNGIVHKTYFTIDGNNDDSKTDMKIKYSDLKVEILKKDQSEVRKFLSDVANLFIKTKKDDGFKEGVGETERNKTQSVFNQLWISVESALKKIIL